MTTGALVTWVGAVCLAGAGLYAARLAIENGTGLGKWRGRARLALYRAIVTKRIPRWLPTRWLALRPGADPVVIGRHCSLAEGYDEAHAARIAEVCRLLAEACGLAADVVASLTEAAHLHDAGMEDWDLDLHQPAPLSDVTRSRLAEHCARGEYLAREVSPDPLVAPWVRWHHERYDGTGYPDGLEGDESPLPAQILGLADTFESMTHSRPHRPALSSSEALAELQRLAGLRFAPGLVACFVSEVYPALADRQRESD